MKKLLALLAVMIMLIPVCSFGQVLINPPPEVGIIFPDTPVDEESIQAITIENLPGNGGQIVVMYQSPDRDIWLEEGFFIIDEGDVAVAAVHFTPSERRIYDIDVSLWVITPNAEFEIPYPVYGRGGGWPHIQIDQQDIECLIEAPEPVERLLRIRNIGGWVLTFEIILDEDVDWLDIAPLRGVIDPGNNNDIDILMTIGEDMPDNGQYQTTVIIESDDPDNPEVEFDVRLTVDIQNLQPLVIELDPGWSMISTNREFPEEMIDEEGPDIQLILADIVANLIIIKDGFGVFCIPDFDFWGIPAWQTAQGYLIKVAEDTELELDGELIPFDRPIQLIRGWNTVAYYPDFESELRFALNDLLERDLLVIAKTGNGEFIVPDFELGMVDTEPGQGYMIKVTADCEFQWAPEPDWNFADNQSYSADELDHFPDPPLTDSNMSVVFNSISRIDINEGAEIACISPRDEISGAIVIEGEAPWGMAVWGDDALTLDIEGFQEGEPLTFVYWDPESNWEMDIQFDVINDVEPVYAHNGLLIVDTEVSVSEIEPRLPLDPGIVDLYPNPFNDRVALVYSLNAPDKVRIGLYDMSGKLVSTLVEEYKPAGRYAISVSGTDLPDGIYVIRMKNSDQAYCRKILHLK